MNGSPDGLPFPVVLPLVLGIAPEALTWQALIGPVALGLGILRLLTLLPWGAPRPDLGERLARLDADARMRRALVGREETALFSSRILEALLRPFIEDVGRLTHLALVRLGFGGGADLERDLKSARPGVDPSQFYGEKLALAIFFLLLFPLLNFLGIHPLGRWPFWFWLAAGAGGFLLPNWDLSRKVNGRRDRLVMELPTILDLLTIALSAGQALEQALALVSRESGGVLGREFATVMREQAVSKRSVVTALEEMAARNGVPELTTLVRQLRAAYDQGLPLVNTLAFQARGLREQKRLRILSQAGRASVQMVLPVCLFILPPLFVILLYPAMIQLLGISGS